MSLRGRLRLTAGAQTVELTADDAASLPGDTEHQLENPGRVLAVFLLLIIRPRGS